MDGDKASATKARILEAARDLFNAEGAGAQSAVDIAAALGISPGHLYYHFKGKAEILSALVHAYQGEVELVLESAVDACRGQGAGVETLWTHVHILTEEAWDARFLYREAGAMALRYPDIAARLRHITAATREALRLMLAALTRAGVLHARLDALDSLARVLTTAIGFHAIELQLEGDETPPRDLIARAVAQMMRLTTGFAVLPAPPSR